MLTNPGIKLAFAATLAGTAWLSALGEPSPPPAGNVPRVLLLVLSGPKSPDGETRLRTAISYAAQLKKGNVQVLLVFDGSGVQWMAHLQEVPHPEALPIAAGAPTETERSKMIGHIRILKGAGVPHEVSPVVAESPDLKRAALTEGLAIAREGAGGRLDIASYVLEGYQIAVF